MVDIGQRFYVGMYCHGKPISYGVPTMENTGNEKMKI